MEWGMVVAFWGVSMLFIMSPGADWSYAISAGIHKRVLPSVTGLLFGHVLATLIVAAGLGLVLAQHPQALMALSLLGAAYLAWMGWQMLPQIILLSSLVGAVIGISMIVIRGRDKNIPIPFGPYLAIAGWIAFVWGDTINQSYLKLFVSH